MATRTQPIVSIENRLLAALPPDEYDRLLPQLQQVSFDLGEVVYEFGGHLDYVARSCTIRTEQSASSLSAQLFGHLFFCTI